MGEMTRRAGQMGTESTGGLEVPARIVPIPDTVSPEMQVIIAQPHDPTFNNAPTTAAEWKAKVAAAARKAVAVYRETLQTTPAANIAIFGTSAGGSLTCTTLLRAKAEGLPMPGAIALGTPTVDLTDAGDSLYTNEGIDNVLGTRDGFIRASVALYANGRDPRTRCCRRSTVTSPAFRQRSLLAAPVTSSYPIPCACTESSERQAWRRYCKCGKARRTRST